MARDNVSGFASRAASCLDVAPSVADHKAFPQVDAEFPRGIHQHARRGLAAIASRFIQVGTNRYCVLSQAPRQSAVHLINDLSLNETACEVWLIGDHHQKKVHRLQPRASFLDAYKQLQVTPTCDKAEFRVFGRIRTPFYWAFGKPSKSGT